eukprot:m.138850 g.138850  ORF g.138850 m.138850 type:complete len:578 (+) comp17040_c1_seq2:162-1895(+)
MAASMGASTDSALCLPLCRSRVQNCRRQQPHGDGGRAAIPLRCARVDGFWLRGDGANAAGVAGLELPPGGLCVDAEGAAACLECMQPALQILTEAPWNHALDIDGPFGASYGGRKTRSTGEHCGVDCGFGTLTRGNEADEEAESHRPWVPARRSWSDEPGDVRAYLLGRARQRFQHSPASFPWSRLAAMVGSRDASICDLGLCIAEAIALDHPEHRKTLAFQLSAAIGRLVSSAHSCSEGASNNIRLMLEDTHSALALLAAGVVPELWYARPQTPASAALLAQLQSFVRTPEMLRAVQAELRVEPSLSVVHPSFANRALQAFVVLARSVDELRFPLQQGFFSRVLFRLLVNKGTQHRRHAGLFVRCLQQHFAPDLVPLLCDVPAEHWHPSTLRDVFAAKYRARTMNGIANPNKFLIEATRSFFRDTVAVVCRGPDDIQVLLGFGEAPNVEQTRHVQRTFAACQALLTWLTTLNGQQQLSLAELQELLCLCARTQGETAQAMAACILAHTTAEVASDVWAAACQHGLSHIAEAALACFLASAEACVLREPLARPFAKALLAWWCELAGVEAPDGYDSD